MKKIILLLLVVLNCAAQTTIQFERQVPLNWNAETQVPSYADIAPNMTLPAGHVFSMQESKQGWTYPLLKSKGITHWVRGASDFDGTVDYMRLTYPYEEYNNVPRTREIFGLNPVGNDEYVNGYNKKWWPNGPLNESQARSKADQQILSRLWVGETMEGEDYMPENQPMWGQFYDQLINRYEAQKAVDGKPYWVAHNYFYIGLGIQQGVQGSNYYLGQKTREVHRAMMNTDPSTWPITAFHPGQPLGRTNLYMVAVYKGTPDAGNSVIGGLYQMELMKKLGKTSGVFLFGVHEWRPNFQFDIRLPEGTLFRSNKVQLEPTEHIAWAFFSQEYGSVYIEWGLNTQASATKKPVDYFPANHATGDYWYPNGATTPQPNFPFYAESGPNRYGGGFQGDMSYWGIALWNKTFGPVASGTPYYARYRINGGTWIEKRSDATDLVDAEFDKRGFVRCRILGNKMAVVYYNPFADNTRKTIEFQHPLDASKIYTATVSGSGIHAALITL